MIAALAGRWAVLAALVAAFGLWVWVEASQHADARWEALRAREDAQAQAEISRLAKRGSEIVLQYVDRVRTVEGRARTITKEIPRYVTPADDARCPVPVGFVRLLSPSADMQAGLYQPSSAVDGAASGVALSTIAEWVTEARRRFELNRSQCESLQAWAASLRPPP